MEQLKKDLITFAIGGVIGIVVAIAGTGGFDLFMVIACFLFFGGIIFGWRIASHIITAFSVVGIIMKAMIALIIGIFAGPIILIRDFISVSKEKKGE